MLGPFPVPGWELSEQQPRRLVVRILMNPVDAVLEYYRNLGQKYGRCSSKKLTAAFDLSPPSPSLSARHFFACGKSISANLCEFYTFGEIFLFHSGCEEAPLTAVRECHGLGIQFRCVAFYGTDLVLRHRRELKVAASVTAGLLHSLCLNVC
jgi:hypothetical protein